MKLSDWIIKEYESIKLYKRYTESGLAVVRISKDKPSENQKYYADIRAPSTLYGFNRWEEVGTYDDLYEAVFYCDLISKEKGFSLKNPFLGIKDEDEK